MIINKKAAQIDTSLGKVKPNPKMANKIFQAPVP